MFRPTHRARLVASLCVALAALTVAPGIAEASPTQSIGDLQAQAKQVAAQLDSLGAKSDALDEAYLEAQSQAQSLKDQVAAKKAAVAKAKSDLTDNQSAARRYAVEAYVTGGDVDPVLLPSSSTADASHRSVYLTTLQGDRQQVIDGLRASQQQLDEEQQSLDAAKAKVDKQLASLDSTRTSLRDTISKENALQSSVTGQLATAVAAEQARIQAAQEAAAAKAAQEAAARAAAQAARTASTVPPRTTTNDAPSKSAGSSAATGADLVAFPDPGPVSPGAATAIAAARSQLGVPYHWAESDPGGGFDCSGLVMYAWGQAGVSLPHSSRGMYSMTQRISADQLQPGDLVFGGSPVHHVGLYVGNGLMINAPHTGTVVQLSSIYMVGPTSFGRI